MAESRDELESGRRPEIDLDAETRVTGTGARPATDSSLRRVDHYLLLAELGRGGQGAVYLAEDERIRRRVALKLLYGGQVLAPEARLRFEREAAVTARLSHPGIARILEFGEFEGIPYIAMELVEGETLAQRIAAARLLAPEERPDGLQFEVAAGSTGSSLPREAAPSAATPASGPRRRLFGGSADFIGAVARALHAAHESGLVHRDMKPGNIMVRPDGSPCMLDFGLAQDQHSEGATLTRTDDRVGTPSYMAPEQVEGRTKEIDRRTDVWALGAVLYECCTFERPFQAPNREELFARIRNVEPPPPRALDPRVPRDLEAIILTALDKDPNRRYATAEDLAEDLRRFRDYEPVQARPAGRLLKALRWMQRNRLVTATAAIVLVSVFGAALVFYLKGREAERARTLAENEAREKGAALARETAALAELTAALETAERERNAKQEALENYERLADVKRIDVAIRAADRLHPPRPELIAELEGWLETWQPLADRLGRHQTLLAELRRDALPYAEDDRARDHAETYAEIRGMQVDRDAMTRRLEDATDPSLKALLGDTIAEIDRRMEAARARTEQRGSWLFDDQVIQFRHDVLTELVAALDRFVNDASGTMHSVRRRIDQSRDLAALATPANDARWRDCAARVGEDPRFPDFRLEGQPGLVPLGPDPDSGLEEFLHFLTHAGPIPERDPVSGRIAVTEELGVVLVLVPGGRFLMGAQKADRAAANFDPAATPQEQPVHPVNLEPFFLAKYEMTQEQWRRTFGRTPSRYGPGTGRGDPRFKAPVNPRHPVEGLSWNDASRLLPQVGLALPTEAEWERAARGGRQDLIWAGTSSVAELQLYANICGAEAAAVGFPDAEPGHRDDFPIHAPVGSFRANAFGLHDMSGNLWEWCADPPGDYEIEPGEQGLRRERPVEGNRVLRGGGFGAGAILARVSGRYDLPAGTRDYLIGLRPARAVVGEGD